MNKMIAVKMFLSCFAIFCFAAVQAQPKQEHDLRFDSLATRWDEAIPLGNGWLGALVYKKGNNMRIALDRVDVWDDRPMPEIDRLKFKWVVGQVKKNQYDTVQKIGDEPYEVNPAPTKIPCAAIEFDLAALGTITKNELHINNAINVIYFKGGGIGIQSVHAAKQIGYFAFSNVPADFIPQIKIPNYNSGNAGATGSSVEGQGLERLGYPKGTVTTGNNFIRYHQPCWKGNYYEVLITWAREGTQLLGQWTISNNTVAVLPPLDITAKDPTDYKSHEAWWKNYWSKSAVIIPDAKIEKQYYLELYKMGCVARANTPPVSLQAIWTADNGNLPPWKGDLHHDLNTELSYWPYYTSNHLAEAQSFTNWLWKVKAENEKWTTDYFGTAGINVPGVTTISGKPMGGWIQYSMSPSTGAWLAQHFYWQWKYSMDDRFLASRAFSYVYNARTHAMSYLMNYAPDSILSSSPEYHDNDIKAWFSKLSSYDWALYKNLDKMAGEMNAARKPTGPLFCTDNMDEYIDSMYFNETGLPIAPSQNLDASHRHHAQLMAIYPLGLLSPDNSKDKNIINNSLRHLEKMGTRLWCGYSFSWAACLYARAREGNNAEKMLRIFANNFVSANSFHLNGDQKGGEYSDFKYRPFTLEGNFAFAQGVQEMLIQSYNGYIEVFPAVPDSWKDVAFKTLRTEGAFLVSAKKSGSRVDEVELFSEKGGTVKLKLPFKNYTVAYQNNCSIKNTGDGFIILTCKPGGRADIKNTYKIP